MKAVAVTLEGVLRKPLDAEALDFGGTMLYQSLAENFRVVVLGTTDEQKDKHWLTTNGYLRHVLLAPERLSDAPTAIGRRRAQVQRLRAEGFVFEFIVVPDPVLATELYRSGFPVLVYLHPEYTAASYRPDYAGGIQSWSDLQAQVQYTRTVSALERAKAKEQEVVNNGG